MTAFVVWRKLTIFRGFLIFSLGFLAFPAFFYFLFRFYLLVRFSFVFSLFIRFKNRIFDFLYVLNTDLNQIPKNEYFYSRSSKKEVPPESAKKFYLKYAEYEEKHGTPRNAMAVYEKMCDAMNGKDKFEVFFFDFYNFPQFWFFYFLLNFFAFSSFLSQNFPTMSHVFFFFAFSHFCFVQKNNTNFPQMYLVYISRASELFGALRIREIFEKALTELPDEFLPPMCVKFAALEIKLGEVDRTRAIFQYGAKMADTRVLSEIFTTKIFLMVEL